MLTDTIDTEMKTMRELLRKDHKTPEDEQRLRLFFGEADSQTLDYRRRAQQAGFAFVMDHHGLTREQTIAVLESPETKRILAESYQPSYS